MHSLDILASAATLEAGDLNQAQLRKKGSSSRSAGERKRVSSESGASGSGGGFQAGFQATRGSPAPKPIMIHQPPGLLDSTDNADKVRCVLVLLRFPALNYLRGCARACRGMPPTGLLRFRSHVTS